MSNSEFPVMFNPLLLSSLRSWLSLQSLPCRHHMGPKQDCPGLLVTRILKIFLLMILQREAIIKQNGQFYFFAFHFLRPGPLYLILKLSRAKYNTIGCDPFAVPSQLL